MSAPRLLVQRSTHAPRAVVLVLHGGQEHSRAPVPRFAPPVIRMIPFARRLHTADDGRIVVARLIHSQRGWNGEQMSPVSEAVDALAQLRGALPGLPIGLVGHSMGGRTAMRVAGEPDVRTVVGLAPWLPPGEPVTALAGRRVLIVHGTSDRTTSPEESRAFAERARAVVRSVGMIDVPGAGHSMLRRFGLWEDLAATFCARTLLADARVTTDAPLTAEVTVDAQAGDRTERAAVTNLIDRALTGDLRITA